MSKYSLISKADYLKRLISHVNESVSGDDILLMTMVVDFDSNLINLLYLELISAAKRSVNIVLLIDAHQFIFSNKNNKIGPLFYSKNLQKVFANGFYQKLNIRLEKLINAGIKIAIINRPNRLFSLAYKDRSHIKLGVINNIVYIGGVNLTDDNHRDYMIKINNPFLANQLFEFSSDLISTNSVRKSLNNNLKITLIDNSLVLLDRGNNGDSIIFDLTLRQIKDATKNILFTCQFFPDRKILQQLILASKRGVRVKLVYNHYLKHKFPFSLLQLVMFKYNVLKFPNNFTYDNRVSEDTYLHSKILICDDFVVIGSHNLINAGVKFNTAEIAFMRKDKKLAQKINLLFGLI